VSRGRRRVGLLALAVGKAVTSVLIVGAFVFVVCAVGGVSLMFGTAIAHAELTNVPTLGFWAATALIGCAAGVLLTVTAPVLSILRHQQREAARINAMGSLLGRQR
jgi:hypothetical protein